MIFYCPNCKKLEVGKISYTEKDFIFTNMRDGYGLMLHNVICKECGYPLSAVVCTNKASEKDQDGVEYYRYVIEGYQDGSFATKEEMLSFIKRIHEESNRYNKEQVIDACNKFLQTND